MAATREGQGGELQHGGWSDSDKGRGSAKGLSKSFYAANRGPTGKVQKEGMGGFCLYLFFPAGRVNV